MPFTHYVPAFTVRRGRMEAAFCNTLVPAGTGTVEPTCPACQRILAEDDEDFQRTALDEDQINRQAAEMITRRGQ